MRLPHATALVVGIMLGASIFVQPSEVVRLVPSARGVLLVWLAAGALTLSGALVCAELAAVFPQTGGVYVFLREIFSPGVAFLWGWAMFWSMHTGIIAAIAVVLARYVGYFVTLSEAGVRLVAIAAIALLTIINCLGVKPGSALQLALTVIKIAAVTTICSFIFIFGGRAHAARTEPLPTATSLAGYALAAGAGLFAFGGWHMGTYAAGETRDAERTIPRALIAGAAIVTACYVLLNAAYQYVLPLDAIAGSSRVAADATERALGTTAGGALAALVVISALGSANGIILAGPRVYYAMARDGVAFRWLGAVEARRQTPYIALAAQALWAAVLVATNSYRQLFTRVVYTEWIFFALLAVGLFVLRKRGRFTPRYFGWAYPVAPALFIVVALAIAANQAAADLRGAAWGVGLVLAGVPVYFFWRLRNTAHA